MDVNPVSPHLTGAAGRFAVFTLMPPEATVIVLSAATTVSVPDSVIGEPSTKFSTVLVDVNHYRV